MKNNNSLSHYNSLFGILKEDLMKKSNRYTVSFITKFYTYTNPKHLFRTLNKHLSQRFPLPLHQICQTAPHLILIITMPKNACLCFIIQILFTLFHTNLHPFFSKRLEIRKLDSHTSIPLVTASEAFLDTS